MTGASARSGGQSQTIPTVLSTLLNSRAAQEYWLRRLLAYVVDWIAVYAVIGLLVAAAELPSYLESVFIPGTASHFTYSGSLFYGLASLIFVLYFTVAEAEYGKTLGKRVMRLSVTTDSGAKPSIGTSLLRNISKIYWVLLLLDVVVGLALDVGYTKKFSDKYLGTKVS